MRRTTLEYLLALSVVMALVIPAWATETESLDDTIAWFTLNEGESIFTYNHEMGWIVIDTGKKRELTDTSYYSITRLIDYRTGLPVDEYDYAGNTSEDLTIVGKWNLDDRKLGFVDKDGKVVIPLEYARADNFSEGLSAVGIGDLENAVYGYINKTGEMVIQPEYDDASAFFDGIAKVAKKDAYGNLKWGLIDKAGKIVAPLEYNEIYYDGENSQNEIRSRIYGENASDASKQPILVAKTGSDGNLQYGYIDKKGTVQIPLIYDKANSFVNGLALVGMKDDSWEIKYGYINVNGDVVVPLEYEDIQRFAVGPSAYSFLQDLVPVSKKDIEGNYTYGYVDMKGHLSIPLQYDLAEGFTSDGLAPVAIVEGDDDFRDRKMGYIDQTGEIVISLEYVAAGTFYDGVATVAKLDDDGNILWGAIDKTGTVIIPLEYNQPIDISLRPDPLKDMLLATKQDENLSRSCKLFDRAGKAILPAEYECDVLNLSSPSLYYGLITVRKKGDTGLRLLDMNGNLILSDEYDRIDTRGSIIVVKKDGRYGVVNNPYWEASDETALSGGLPIVPIIISGCIAVVLIAVIAVLGAKRKRRASVAEPISTTSSAPQTASVQTISTTKNHTSTNGPKFCPNCGSPLNAGSKFCSECGSPIQLNE